MIERDYILKNLSFYERFGFMDLVYNFSKFNNININDVLDNYTITDLVNYYNTKYRFDLIYKFRLIGTKDNSKREVVYKYVGKIILTNDDLVMKSGNSANGKVLSSHLLTTDSKDCKILFGFLNKDVQENDATNTKTHSQLSTKCVNVYKQQYSTFTSIQLISQLITTSTDNKFYYSKKIKDKFFNTAFIPDFKNIESYISLFDYLYNKNVTHLLKAEVRDKDIDENGIINFFKKPPLYFNGNINSKFSISDERGYSSDFVYINMLLNYINDVKKADLDTYWYEINSNDVRLISIDKTFLDMIKNNVKFSENILEFTKEIINKPKDITKEKNKSLNKKIFTFYNKFDYNSLRDMLKPNKGSFLEIKENNLIINKFMEKRIESESLEILKKFYKDVNYKVYLISKDKAEKNNKSGDYVYIETEKAKIKKMLINKLIISSDIISFISNISTIFSKYMKYTSTFNESTINDVMSIDIKMGTFREISNILLNTRFENQKDVEEVNDDVEEETFKD